MKVKTLSLLAGLGVPLIVTSSAAAGFVGLKVVGKDNPYGLLVCNVYAEFDRPGEDLFLAVAGTAGAPMVIQVLGGGTFHKAMFGTDRPPSTSLIAAFPSLAFDSFVTIGVKAVGVNGQPADNMTITPGFPGLEGTQLFTTTSGWAITPDEPASDPFNPDFYAGNGQVLIGQFATSDGTGISGTMLTRFVSNGDVQTRVVSFFHVPAPGAVGLIAAVGLLGAGQRKRGSP